MKLEPVMAAVLFVSAACIQQMADQPRYEPLEASDFFADGRASRDLPEGVIPRGGAIHEEGPPELTLDLVRHGRERYDIYCAPCHGYIGNGDGMAVRRGFRQPPPSFHLDRLLQAPDEHFYDVMTNGFGAMYDYAGQVSPPDRWAVVAYIRALQLSQNAGAGDLNREDLRRLEEARR